MKKILKQEKKLNSFKQEMKKKQKSFKHRKAASLRIWYRKKVYCSLDESAQISTLESPINQSTTVESSNNKNIPIILAMP